MRIVPAENLELSNVLSFKPGAGQNKALNASSTAVTSVLISALSISFEILFDHMMVCILLVNQTPTSDPDSNLVVRILPLLICF